jgi:hypothetical protein
MKILFLKGQYSDQEGVRLQEALFKPDSCILNRSLPYFIPDYAARMEAQPCLVARISRLGKNIAAPFAHKYCDALTAGLHLQVAEFRQVQRGTQAVVEALSSAMDCSAVIGKWLPKEEVMAESVIFFGKNGSKPLKNYTFTARNELIEAGICMASAFMTLRTGDLLFTALPVPPVEIEIGDALAGGINDSEVLHLRIK